MFCLGFGIDWDFVFFWSLLSQGIAVESIHASTCVSTRASMVNLCFSRAGRLRILAAQGIYLFLCQNSLAICSISSTLHQLQPLSFVSWRLDEFSYSIFALSCSGFRGSFGCKALSECTAMGLFNKAIQRFGEFCGLVVRRWWDLWGGEVPF